MALKEYFEKVKGFGILSTADGNGRVNSAVYARPHVMEDGLLAFIMRDRLTYKNIQENPHAVYMFRQDGPGYNGRRLHLTKIKEEKNSELIGPLSRRQYTSDQDRKEPKFLVFFKLEKVRPLIGNGQ